MRNVLIFVGFLVAAIQAESTLEVVTSDEGHYYIVETKKDVATFYEAEKLCDVYQYDLITIDSKEKQEDLARALKKSFSSDILSDLSLWIGAGYQDGEFMWISNFIDFNYTNWDSNFPIKDINESHDTEWCVVMDTKKFLWMNTACDNQHGYICEPRDSKDIIQARRYEREQVKREKRPDNYKELKAQLEKVEMQIMSQRQEILKLRPECENTVMKYISEELKKTAFDNSPSPATDLTLEKSNKPCIYNNLAELAGIEKFKTDEQHNCVSEAMAME